MADLEEQIREAAAQLPPAQQRQALEFLHALRRKLDDEEAAVGEAGVRLAVETLEPEDFSDWIMPEKPTHE